jgi:predicted GNAT family acetyltransferase
MDDQRSTDDRALDEALEESFPASDAPANTVETGIQIRTVPDAPRVIDSRAAHRFELTIDGQTAFLLYERTIDALRLVHTEVPPPLRHRHLGEALVEAALDDARKTGLRVVALCPFVKAYLRKHPQRI